MGQMLHKQGVEFASKGQWPKALDRFQKAEKVLPEFDLNMAYRAVAEFAADPKPDRTRIPLLQLKQALEADPDSMEYYYLYGLVHALAGNNKKAWQYFHRVIEEMPSHVEATRQLRRINLAQEEPQKTGIFTWTRQQLEKGRKK